MSSNCVLNLSLSKIKNASHIIRGSFIWKIHLQIKNDDDNQTPITINYLMLIVFRFQQSRATTLLAHDHELPKLVFRFEDPKPKQLN